MNGLITSIKDKNVKNNGLKDEQISKLIKKGLS